MSKDIVKEIFDKHMPIYKKTDQELKSLYDNKKPEDDISEEIMKQLAYNIMENRILGK